MSFFGFLLGLCAIVFWVTRVIVAFTASMEIEFFLTPLDLRIEIILSFVTLLCIILIFKRSIIGAILYLVSYWSYFGAYIYKIFTSTDEVIVIDYLNVFVSTIGVILPFIILMNIGFSQNSKKTSMKTKKTDWYFQNKDFDRQYDERADRNQYKF